MNRLVNGLKTNSPQNVTRTENGAVTNKSTGSAVLDFFYHSAAKRGKDNEVVSLFSQAYRENAQQAVIALFYVRDIRGGQGERSMFRACLSWLDTNDRTMFNRVIPFIPEYGRYDDMLHVHANPFVRAYIQSTLFGDMNTDRPSLLAKWMPSNNTSSKQTRQLAGIWEKILGYSPRNYRKTLSELRTKIRLVETAMSAGKFDTIEYDKVPSKASYKYRKAFAKRDFARYSAFLEAVKRGEKKINAATMYPYEIVGKYMAGVSSNSFYRKITKDETLEQLWKALPDYIGDHSFLPVVDTSGSMFTTSTPSPITVAVSVGIYSAQRNKGAFKNMYINFNTVATAYTLQGNTLAEIVQNVASNSNWGGSTNLQSVFELVLNTAIRNNVPQSDMPDTIVVISDMEFNPTDSRMRNWDEIKRKYAKAGYALPTIAFWNVASRGKQTPVTMDENGVMLISGCSPSIFKSALGKKVITPYDMMCEVLNSERYAPLAQALW